MAQLTQTVQQSLTPEVLGQISRQLGVDENTAQQGIDVALPLLVSALSRNASQSQGASALARAIQRDHDGSVISQPAQAIQRYQSGEGGKILGHILGDQKDDIERTVSQGTGLDAGALLGMLAPLVLGALGGQMQRGGLDAQSLPGALQSAESQYQNQNGGLMSILNSMLDSNRNGSALDDVAGMLGQMMRQRGQR